MLAQWHLLQDSNITYIFQAQCKYKILLSLKSVANICLAAIMSSFLKCATSGGHSVSNPMMPFTIKLAWVAMVSWYILMMNARKARVLIWAPMKSTNTSLLNEADCLKLLGIWLIKVLTVDMGEMTRSKQMMMIGKSAGQDEQPGHTLLVRWWHGV